MCGIVAALGIAPNDKQQVRQKVLRAAKALRHRGPDWSGIHDQETAILAHERLAIVDPESGGQPLIDPSGKIALTVNGEIYNHRTLRAELETPYDFSTDSDCEVILPLYLQKGEACVQDLDGMFAFVLSDAESGAFLVARDAIGVIPLYYGVGRDGALWFASELKAIESLCERFEVFPPGHLYSHTSGGPVRWYQPDWFAEEPPSRPVDLDRLRGVLEAAVVKRMMSDVPWGVLLSGGLDSSLVASIACRHAARRTEDGGKTQARWPRVHSFCIGLEGSPDLEAAQKVADYLDTVHHAYTYTIQEGIDALHDVIYHLETYDVTTIRASTPMYLMARKIRALGVKMVLSGEGADEIFGGYLYFHKAPNADEFHSETVQKLKTLHLFDCLRANKSTSAWGVEARVPFLDKSVLAEAMGIDATDKMSGSHPDGARIEKYILRKAFDDADQPYLPAEILWRQKEQFSDGVGYGWIDALRDLSEAAVSDAQMANAAFRFPVNPPATKEAYFYRQIFNDHFESNSAQASVPGGPSIACSTAKAIEWDESFKASADPSGRAVAGVHSAAYSTK